MSFNGFNMYTDYDEMPHTNLNVCSVPDYGAMNAALLVRLAGSVSNSGYGILGSCDTYTLPWNLSAGFSALFYSSGGSLGSYSSKFNSMKTDLKTGFPVIYVGTTGTLNFNDAHIWVGDGLKETYGTYGYEYPIEEMDPTILYYYDPDTGCMNYHYHHVSFVWGWQNTDINEWYYAGELIGDFNDYDSYLHILTGIRP